jgi:hypothetical protein
LNLVRFYGFEVPPPSSWLNRRNFKSSALSVRKNLTVQDTSAMPEGYFLQQFEAVGFHLRTGLKGARG